MSEALTAYVINFHNLNEDKTPEEQQRTRNKIFNLIENIKKIVFNELHLYFNYDLLKIIMTVIKPTENRAQTVANLYADIFQSLPGYTQRTRTPTQALSKIKKYNENIINIIKFYIHTATREQKESLLRFSQPLRKIYKHNTRTETKTQPTLQQEKSMPNLVKILLKSFILYNIFYIKIYNNNIYIYVFNKNVNSYDALIGLY